ncbi:MAG TPA: sugar phosphate isomerase/epimerase family protein [Pirellulales bacterium]|jgi:hexulose-6-phosphate isomerase|nr:sugar phosphate isomerase/epimerase family protein [Pirellulales bacterium]
MSAAIARRDCLKAAGIAAAATLVAEPQRTAALWAAEPAPPAKREIKKAIMYATIGFPGSVLEKLRAVKGAGFAGVEPMSHMNHKEVLEALDATGLKAASVCCSTHWDKPISDPDEAVRKQGVDGLLQTLKDAKAYGASSVLFVPGRVNEKTSYDECWKRSIPEIRKAIPTAQELGVKIAIENVWNNFITKPEQAKQYLAEIDSEWVGWHFDIGNVIKYSPPETWIPVIGKKILKLHVKEYSKAKGFGVRLFEGDDNWPAIMQALDAIEYKGWGISEQPGDQTKDFASFQDLSSRMDKAFAS